MNSSNPNLTNFKKGFFSKLGSYGASALVYTPMLIGAGIAIKKQLPKASANKKYNKLLKLRPNIQLTPNEILLTEKCVHFPEDSKRDLDFIIIDEESRKMLSKINIGKHNNFLLHGPPGTGKTVLCEAICKTNNIIYIDMDGVKEPYFGKTENNILERYYLAKKISNCAIFIDEVDELCPDRSMVKIIGADSTNTLLKITVKNVSNADKILWIAATNHENQVDPAIRSRLTPIKVDPLSERDMKKLIDNYFLYDLKIVNPNLTYYFFKKIGEKFENKAKARDIENYITRLESYLDINPHSSITENIIDDIFASKFFGKSRKRKSRKRKSRKRKSRKRKSRL